MNVDAIIFDKDGTLIDFDAFWVTISVEAIKDILRQLCQEDDLVCEILEAFGVHNGVADINGVLCKGTYKQMGQIVYDIVSRYGCDISRDEVEKVVIRAYTKNSDKGEITPTSPDLLKVLTELKKRNKKLAVVTTDNEEITRKCLKELRVEELFDKIYTDDGIIPTKPDPYCVFDFCKLTGVKRECMVMIGDTMTDVDFAKNAGIRIIGVAKNDQNKQILAPRTDAVITDISHIFKILN